MLCFFERWMDRCCAFLILLCFFVTLQRRKNDFFPYFRRRKDGWIDAVLFLILLCFFDSFSSCSSTTRHFWTKIFNLLIFFQVFKIIFPKIVFLLNAVSNPMVLMCFYFILCFYFRKCVVLWLKYS